MTKKDSHGPMNVKPLILNVLEKMISYLIYQNMEKILNQSFSKIWHFHSTQNLVFSFIKIYQKEFDKSSNENTLFMHLQTHACHVKFSLRQVTLINLIALVWRYLIATCLIKSSKYGGMVNIWLYHSISRRL